MTKKSRQAPALKPRGFQAGPGTVVALSYELYDAEGELVEASDEAPVEVLLGFGEASPALERALEGLSAGDERTVSLSPDEAFGPRDPDAFIQVDRAELPEGVAVGDELQADRENGGGVVPLKVVEISDEVAVLDTNHPLAGQRVKLRARVLSVRPATEAEMGRAAERLSRDPGPGEGALLPAERLLRRKA
jgi:FKBP-type peptidyl-prolyl cis-trans isomerase SlyD